MQLLIATMNRHKAREFASIFADHDVRTPNELGITFDVEETGDSFLSNAMLKATRLREQIDDRTGPASIVVADDSGLCVDALSGAPGIYSARFGSPDGGKTELDAPTRNEILLRALDRIDNRRARFVCCMVALLPNDRFTVAQESWEGEIARGPSAATGGFGYDPVFHLPELGCTAADLPAAEKNRLSHRGRASRVLAAAIRAALREGPEGGA